MPPWDNNSINIGGNKPQKNTILVFSSSKIILVTSSLGFVHTDFEINLGKQTFTYGQLVGTSLYSHRPDYCTVLLAWIRYIHDVRQVAHTVAQDLLAHNFSTSLLEGPLIQTI